MATHRFVCGCGEIVEDTTTKGIHKCPKCKQDMALDCKIAIHGNYRNPIISDSLAVAPDQIEEHRRLFPDIKMHDDGRPEFNNFTKHEAYLKKTGFVKETQKIKRSGAKRIA